MVPAFFFFGAEFEVKKPFERRFLRVSGIVQGVGFRPFAARLAGGLGLTGQVANTTRGVEIEIQGKKAVLDEFCSRLERELPPVALILGVECENISPVSGENSFKIVSSRTDPVSSVIIPPDIATCPKCLAELLDPSDRRFGYPFINCTDCGPRYTIIEKTPYDRPNTSMAGFTMCPACETEYEAPQSRRFHAQPNACPACGPSLWALDGSGERIDSEPVAEAARILSSGGIVALLGIGGFHLACDAANEDAVTLLRRRKKRPGKPFAVMADSMKTARSAGRLSQGSERELAGPWAPIVLCPSRETSPVTPSVAPGQNTVGLFLPYAPLHHLLFKDEGSPRLLVMTSGNRSDEPLISTVKEALEKLGGVADLFLVHDRPIIHPVDDSVLKDMGSLGVVAVRRARGYAPRPVPVKGKNPGTVLAVGAELMSAVTVLQGGLAFVGSHVGDLKNLETEEYFRRGVTHLLELLRARPVLAACDLHPSYRSTAFAEEYSAEESIPLLRIQHHEAHGAGCMAENSFTGEGVVLALDGVGYGHDGTIWGGEILTGKPGSFSRKAHLLPVPQPGGDSAALEPWRMAASHLRLIAGSGWKELPLGIFRGKTPEELTTLDAMMEKGLGSPLTSSCGRLFDSAAAIALGIEGRILYSAQGPMELEAAASRSLSSRNYPEGKITPDGSKFIIDPSPLLQALLDDALKNRDKSAMARSFHEALAKTFFTAAKSVAEREGLNDVFLTGGCFFNSILAESLKLMLEKEGLKVHHHRLIPPGDGGISYGQASWIALKGS